MLDNILFQRQQFSQDDNACYVHLDFQVTFKFASISNEDQLKLAEQARLKVYGVLRDRLRSADSLNELRRSQNAIELAKDAERPAKRTHNRSESALTNDNFPHDAQLAQTICQAIYEAAARIEKIRVPSWWSDLEKLKPKGATSRLLDVALEASTEEQTVIVEELDRSCTEYNAGLLSRVAMTWLIRCFIEGLSDKSSIGPRGLPPKLTNMIELVDNNVCVWGSCWSQSPYHYTTHMAGEHTYSMRYSRVSRQALHLRSSPHANLCEAAQKNHFDPRDGGWRKFSKRRIAQLASRIASNLLTEEYDHIWRDIDQGLAFDPAEFFTGNDPAAGSISNLSYDHARKVLGLISPKTVTESRDITSASSGSVESAYISAVPALNLEQSGWAELGEEFSMNPVPDLVWPCTADRVIPGSAVLPSICVPGWREFGADFNMSMVPNPLPSGTANRTVPGPAGLPATDLAGWGDLEAELNMSMAPNLSWECTATGSVPGPTIPGHDVDLQQQQSTL
ncbi:hypothetical protein LTR49_026521 [Elasticomyces elasticus]|nr:hypothetical protein LTR49_026521 [Elasticomyces elasticus]